MGRIAELLGTPFMPWQQMVADVAGEIDPETGCYAYREVIVTVMRQNGKTTLLFPHEVWRCVGATKERVAYTAQTGTDARDKLLSDQVPILQQSVLFKAVRQIYRAKGEEAIRFNNGSAIVLESSMEGSGHGFTLDMGVLDECWEDEDDRREQSMLPGMNTRPMAQMWLTSTQGTDKSSYLNRKTLMGRHASEEDTGTGIAYFEWSIPAEADIESPEVWWRFMPALGWTIPEASIAHAFQTMEEAEWRRAYGNQPTRLERDRVFPGSLWQAVCDPRAEAGRGERLVFGIDVLPDRSAAAIVACDGKVVELVEHQPGTGWILERLNRLLADWGAPVVVDGGGPAASVADDLESDGFAVERLNTAGMAAACASLYDAIADRKVTFRTDGAFDVAVEGLARRPIADRFIWSRAASASDITPFVAATIAYERAIHNEPVEVQFYSFG